MLRLKSMLPSPEFLGCFVLKKSMLPFPESLGCGVLKKHATVSRVPRIPVQAPDET